MPRMTAEQRRALCEEVVIMREENRLITFDAIAQALGLPTRQSARLLYKQGIQHRMDEDALNCLDNGDQVDPYTTLSKRVEAKIRRENPALLIGYDRVRSSEALIRSRGDGTEQEPW